MAPIITLATDFGLKDGFVGVMKGVILGLAPEARVVDLTHLIGPQNIDEASVVLDRHAPYFPDSTIHVVVVDPGVGTSRRPIAAQVGPQRYVGPDNGTLTRLLRRAERQQWPVAIHELAERKFWRQEISNVFHGRDIFAPVAAHLANGVALNSLGPRVTDPVRLPIRLPERTASGLRGEVKLVDHFGNIATSIHRDDFNGLAAQDLIVRLCGREINGLVQTFGERAPGEVVALFGSTGDLTVSVVNGNAGQVLSAKVGDPVEVRRA